MLLAPFVLSILLLFIWYLVCKQDTFKTAGQSKILLEGLITNMGKKPYSFSTILVKKI